MTLGTPLLSLVPIVGVAILAGSVTMRPVGQKPCSTSRANVILAAQQAIKGRLPNLQFPIFSYAADDRTYVSNDRCAWTMYGHVEGQTVDGDSVRLGWVVNLSLTPGDETARRVDSSVVF